MSVISVIHLHFSCIQSCITTEFCLYLCVFRHIHCDASHRLALQQVYLYWVCPDMLAFEWFQQLLKSLEAQVAERGDPNFLRHQIYLTRGWDNEQVRNLLWCVSWPIHDLWNHLLIQSSECRLVWGNFFSCLAISAAQKFSPKRLLSFVPTPPPLPFPFWTSRFGISYDRVDLWIVFWLMFSILWFSPFS